MGKIFNSILAVTLAVSMSATPLSAQRHRSGGNSNPRSTERARGNNHRNSGSRPGDNSRPANRPANNRPENRPGNNRPGNNRPDNKPGNRPGNDRPNNHPGNNRPGHGRPNNRPGHNRPGHGWGNSAPRPGTGSVSRPGYRPTHIVPPPRPGRPPMRPYCRPVPPPAWHPRPNCPVFAGFVGFTLGTAFSASLDYLYNNGYTVDGYGDNVVYLRNVTQLRMLWPDATLYYGPGGLVGSQFLYSTPYSDRSRYNIVYSQLTRMYGMPVSNNNFPGGSSATWFGADGSYIQLEYKPMVTSGGFTSHFTILQYGN